MSVKTAEVLLIWEIGSQVLSSVSSFERAFRKYMFLYLSVGQVGVCYHGNQVLGRDWLNGWILLVDKS